jgi:hypothetical protein
MATNRRILNLPLILSGNVTSSVVLPLDDPSDNLTKKINLGQIKNFVLSGVSLSGNYLSLSGGTVTGSTNFTSGLTANSFIINNSYTPTSSGDTFGSIGQLTWDDDYLYVKTNNGWGRSILDYIF